MSLPHREYAAELTRTLTDEANSDAVQEFLEAKGVDYDHTDVAEIERMIERAQRGFGRRNPHCSNCGDERGGDFGHEISECQYRSGMTVEELAATMPPLKANRYWDAMLDRYFEHELRR